MRDCLDDGRVHGRYIVASAIGREIGGPVYGDVAAGSYWTTIGVVVAVVESGYSGSAGQTDAHAIALRGTGMCVCVCCVE